MGRHQGRAIVDAPVPGPHPARHPDSRAGHGYHPVARQRPVAIRSTGQLWHDRLARPFTYRLGGGSDAAAAADELWDYVAGLACGQTPA
jgi:hypothetical protein